jgi:hypothetical protein
MSRPALAFALTALVTSACGGGGASGPVEPGEWEVTTVSGAPNGRQMNGSTSTRCLRATQDDPTREIVLQLIGRDSCEPDKVRVANGRIGGVLQCPEYYSFSAHEEPVSGRYSGAAIELHVDMPIFGHTLRQSVSAKRVGDC